MCAGSDRQTVLLMPLVPLIHRIGMRRYKLAYLRNLGKYTACNTLRSTKA